MKYQISSTFVMALICTALLAFGSSLLLAQESERSVDSAVEHLKQQSKAFSGIVKNVAPAVVYIQVEKSAQQTMQAGPGMGPDMLRKFFEQHQRGRPGLPDPAPREYIQRGQGSGFVVSADGYILTNNHVIEDAKSITVYTHDEQEWTAELVGTDPESDVALLKIKASDLPSLKLGSSQKLEIGEWVLALGSPFGFTKSVTAGIVSAKGRDRVGIVDYENFIQTDAAINPGNSGGPLVNLDGEVVGINTAIYSRSGGSMGIGFAIPMDMVKPIFNQLKEKGAVTRGFLGVMIQEIDKDLAESFGLNNKKGALVSQVMPDSPAEKGGLKQGDVVIAFKGKPVKSMQAFRRSVAMVEPGEKVAMRIMRDNEEKELNIIIGKRSSDLAQKDSSINKNELGLQLRSLTKDVAEAMGLEHGVLISGVEANSAAARAGLRTGEVILSVQRKTITQVKQAHAAINKALESKGRVLLLIHNGQGARYTIVKAEH